MMDLAAITDVYRGSNGDATKAMYAALERLGPPGIVAVNLFRACKCSERAKLYRGRGYKSEAYGRKDWSIGNLAKVLVEHHAAVLPGLAWGWGIDENLRRAQSPHYDVIYVELPSGQISFHNGTRYAGPDYTGQWDGVRGVGPDRICQFVADVFAKHQSVSAKAE